ncbi:MAG: hypothetical protein LW860_11970 [Xanthomonadaceae bacterium]|jgi:hypothetical protein|nr:hypothetical protein [Xanthomonadaceae bacterium]
MATVTVDHGGRGSNLIWHEGNKSLTFRWVDASVGFEVSVPTRGARTRLGVLYQLHNDRCVPGAASPAVGHAIATCP